MLNSPRNSLLHNEQAKLAINYNELLKELSSSKMASVGCYTLGETIGQGTYGKVKKGVHKLTGKVVAIKKINKKHAPVMVREIHHHKQLRHPNIIMLYEMISTETSIHIISEYASNGDLLGALAKSGGRCTEDRVFKWFHQMTDAIGYCHTRGIVHRDLKLENILLDKDDNVKICDFGFTRFTQKNQLLDTFCGSLCNSAPEIVLRKKYTGPETDIWSLGVILYTLISGEYPFDDDSEINTQRSIVQVDYQMPSYFSSDLANLIDGILQFEPSARLSIDEIKAHPWLRQKDEQLSKSTQGSTHDFRDLKHNNIAWSSTDTSGDFIKSSPVLSKENERLNHSDIKSSLRFSMPALDYRSTTKNSLFRSSWPSSNQHDLPNENPIVTRNKMSPCEKRLLNALDAAGFDKGTLIKMQTGECDTSRTLWHLLLENMNKDTRSVSDTSSINSVTSDSVFVSENDHQKENIKPYHAMDTHCNRRNRLSSNENTMQMEKLSNMTSLDQTMEQHPSVPTSANIQIVGFGSCKVPSEKSSWISSIKSWFSASNKQQQQQQQQEKIEKQHAYQDDTCDSPICLDEPNFRPSNISKYPEMDLQKMNTPILAPMTPPIYRSGSEKYRRHEIQLSNPPADEADQLCNPITSYSVNLTRNKKYYTDSIQQKNRNELELEYRMPSPPPPTAECYSSTRADNLSLLIYTQPMEMDVCGKQYSMYRHQQPTPPPSPPVTELDNSLDSPSRLTEDDSKASVDSEHTEIRDAPVPQSCIEEKKINRFKLNSPVRPRLALYGLQQQKQLQTKIIIEEEEEEEEY